MPGIASSLYMGGTEFFDEIDECTPTADGADSTISGFEDSDADEDAPQTSVPGKGLRARGGKPAINKPVTDPLNSDDERIAELKHQGYNNHDICTKLIAEGRVRYEQGTIQSRWVRIRTVRQKAEDERLDDELSDWHLGEDDELEKAVSATEVMFEHELKKLVDKKWKQVSERLHHNLKKKDKKYTGTACKERWEALSDNTALMPIEIDPDQAGRKRMREERIAEAKQIRAEEKAEVQRLKQAEQDAKQARRNMRIQRAHEKLEANRAREAEKAEVQRIKNEKKTGQQQNIRAREQARKDWRAALDEKRRIRELEERVYRSITGKNLNRMHRYRDAAGNKKKGYEVESEDDGAQDAGDEEEGIMVDYISDADEDKGNLTDVVSDHESDRYDDDSDNGNVNDTSTQSKPKPFIKAKVTKTTLENPRSIMSDDELKILLHKRGLPRRRAEETHPQVVARIAAADIDTNSTELNNILREQFQSSRGCKEVKIQRMQAFEALNSEAGFRGARADDPEWKKGYVGYNGRFASLIAG